MTAAYEGKLIASTKKDSAFLTKGFTYWKEATTAFKNHDATRKQTKLSINLLPKQAGDIGEMLSKKHSDQKAANKEVFLRILQNLRFLTRQGLALRGTHGEELIFIQLFYLVGEDC